MDRKLIYQKIPTKYFKEFNNFHGMMTVLASFNATPITRLKSTWAELTESDTKILTELQEIMNYQGNYKNYRKILNDIPENTPALPYIGIFLTDLTFIYDGNPTYLFNSKNKNEEEIINFPKFELTSSVMLKLKRHNYRYPFQQIPAIINWFNDLKVFFSSSFFLLFLLSVPVLDTPPDFHCSFLSSMSSLFSLPSFLYSSIHSIHFLR